MSKYPLLDGATLFSSTSLLESITGTNNISELDASLISKLLTNICHLANDTFKSPSALLTYLENVLLIKDTRMISIKHTISNFNLFIIVGLIRLTLVINPLLF